MSKYIVENHEEARIRQVVLYSEDTLKYKIESKEHIKNKYKLERPYYSYRDDEKIPEDKLISGVEIFREHPIDKRFAVSNYGRVLFRETPNDEWHILNQDHKSNSNTTLRIIGKTIEGLQDTHRLVADTWLEKPSDESCEVHHINDDGYDNRPENLIYLKPEIHRKLNKSNNK